MLIEENVLLVSGSGLQTSAPPGRWEEIGQSPGCEDSELSFPGS